MNYEEEQKSELEALREIYYNEIEVLSEELPISFCVRVRTQAFCCETFDAAAGAGDSDGDDDDDDYEDEDEDCGGDGDQEDGDDEGYITIRFDLPPKYPDEKPKISIKSADLNEDEQKDLEADLDRRAEESLGMVMILTLVSGIDEWFSSRAEEEEEPEEVAPKKPDLAEQKVFDGTLVTVETFMAWKRKFEAEMKPKAAAISSDGRLTGRAMFECDKTLAESDLNFVEDLDQTEIEALMQEISTEDNQEDDDDVDFNGSELDDEDLEGIDDEEDDDED